MHDNGLNAVESFDCKGSLKFLRELSFFKNIRHSLRFGSFFARLTLCFPPAFTTDLVIYFRTEFLPLKLVLPVTSTKCSRC
jgi:hypothetical protein